MKCIIPYGGSDFYSKKHGCPKPLVLLDGKKMIERTVFSRSYYGEAVLDKDIIFVLCDENKGVNEFIGYLSNFHPECNYVITSHYTKGAFSTCMLALPLFASLKESLLIDLADIVFSDDIQWSSIKGNGLIPYFISENPKYSYLERSDNGEVTRVIEKEKISKYATAGLYYIKHAYLAFENSYRYEKGKSYHYRNLLYVAPFFNFLKNVYSQEVQLEKCYSTIEL